MKGEEMIGSFKKDLIATGLIAIGLMPAVMGQFKESRASGTETQIETINRAYEDWVKSNKYTCAITIKDISGDDVPEIILSNGVIATYKDGVVRVVKSIEDIDFSPAKDYSNRPELYYNVKKHTVVSHMKFFA